MLEGKKYRFVYYIGLFMALAYLVGIFIPGFQTEENSIYFKIWLTLALSLLAISSFLNRKK